MSDTGFLRNLKPGDPVPEPYDWRETIGENQESDYLVVREYRLLRSQAGITAAIALLDAWEPTLGQFITCQ